MFLYRKYWIRYFFGIAALVSFSVLLGCILNGFNIKEPLWGYLICILTFCFSYMKLTGKYFLEKCSVIVENGGIKFTSNKKNIEIFWGDIEEISLQLSSLFGEQYLIFLCKLKNQKNIKFITAPVEDRNLNEHPLGKVIQHLRSESVLQAVSYENEVCWCLKKQKIEK